MKRISSLVLVTSAMALSACLPDLTESGFQTPTVDGAGNAVFVSGADESATITSAKDPTSGNAYAYSIGVSMDSFLGIEYPVVTAQAGVMPGAVVGALPGTGTATMTGAYEVVHFNVLDDASTLEANADDPDALSALFRDAGAITLTADFDAGTLTGAPDDANIDMTVNGAFTSDVLGGSITHDGVTATLLGEIGGDAAVAAFQNSGGSTLLVGGFTVSE